MFKLLFLRSKLLYLGILSFSTSICFALQLSNLSNIFKFLGVNSSNLPWLWLVPPLTGLIIQPLIGQLSDDTATKYGKRMPYIIGWGILCIISTIALPFISTISLAIFITLIMDCSLNGSTEALRALTSDITKDKERSQALALQGFFAGLGAAIGSSLPFIIHKCFTNGPLKIGTMPCNLRYSFYLTAIILLVVLLFCSKHLKEKIVKESYLNSAKRIKKLWHWRLFKVFSDIIKNIKTLPPKFRKLCYIHSLGWIGIFIFWLYFSTTIAQNIYEVPFFHANSVKYINLWEKASIDTSLYFSIYQYVSIAYALMLYFLPKNTNLKLVHAISLLIGGSGILLLGFATHTAQITLSMIMIGIMWGSIITLPYIIAMQLLPKGKTGAYLGIFNICITIPQLFCGLLLSPLYTYLFQQHAGYLLSFAGALIIASGALWIKELDKKQALVLAENYSS